MISPAYDVGMNNTRCVDLFTTSPNGGIVISSFCFVPSAIKAAHEMGHTSFVVAILGRVQHVEGNINAHAFMRGNK